MDLKIVLFGIVATILVASGEKARFDFYRVIEVNVANEHQRQVLEELEITSDSIQFLDSPVVKRNVELVVPPHKFADIEDIFAANRIQSEIKTFNLQEHIDEETDSTRFDAGFTWTAYNKLDKIYAWLDEQIGKHPNILKNLEIATSYENRTVRGVLLSKKPGNKKIFIESTIHAREWITAATATYLLNELLNNPNDPRIVELSEKYDWVIVPVLNVDGYEYTHTRNRMWRKTRQPHTSSCFGADPNRNFDAKHCAVGASTSPCSETYCGPKPNSEPEILGLTQFVQKLDNLALYISFHSYSQLLLFPYGHTESKAPNHAQLQSIGDAAGAAIKQRYGTQYKVGPIATTIYLASGSSIDWAYENSNVSLAYTFEFRDKGRYGFILPPNQIIPNSLEIIDGLYALVNKATEYNYFN